MKLSDFCIHLIYGIQRNIRLRFILTPFVLVISGRILDLAGYTSQIISLFKQLHLGIQDGTNRLRVKMDEDNTRRK